MNIQEYLENFTPPAKGEKNGFDNFVCTTLQNGNLRFNFQGNFNKQFQNCSIIYNHFSKNHSVNIKPQNQNWLVLYVNYNSLDQKNDV